MPIKFTKVEDDFLIENLDKCSTTYDLTDLFNERFPNHPTKCDNLRHRLALLGLRKGTHNIRKGKARSVNALETVIAGSTSGHNPGDRHGARVKTENGYVSANGYFRRKYFGDDAKGIIVNLNGDKTDFSRENVALVSRSVWHSLCWRSWLFTDPELTKVAILTAELLSFFPDLTHNENQYYKLRGNYNG